LSSPIEGIITLAARIVAQEDIYLSSIGQKSQLQRDIEDHDVAERVMRQKSALDVGAPDVPDTRLAAIQQPAIVITSDHFKFGAPNRRKVDGDMRHHRHRR
jgi:hypothetical protein